VAAALVLGGYLGPWPWTGFTGNTLWDWLNLLFLPLLVPAIAVPMLSPRVTGEVVYLDAEGRPVRFVAEGEAAEPTLSTEPAVSPGGPAPASPPQNVPIRSGGQ